MKDARIAVTGAAGTVGRELIRQLLLHPVAEVRALDNDEGALFFLEEDHRNEPRLQVFLTDVRDGRRLTQILAGVDYLFHAAALKHVPLCERSPFDAVQTNIIGVQNVIEASFANDIRKVLFTSSDKAVNPTNVMGTSKLMGERLMTAANALRKGDDAPRFASTRFGNVAGSRGSVIPLFCQQIAKGAEVTLTDPAMTRFVMTLADAVGLVMESMMLAVGGEVFVTKMSVLRIADLAEVMIEVLAPVFGHRPDAIAVGTIGPRPGEKMYEELMNDEEKRRSLDIQDLLVVLPAFRNIYRDFEYVYGGRTVAPVETTYNSANIATMGAAEIREFLTRPGVLEEGLRRKVQEREEAS